MNHNPPAKAARNPVALAMRHRYQELSMPIVIIAGTNDRVVKDSQAVWLREEIPHSILRLVPGVGHMVHYAIPDEVAKAIEEAGKSATMFRRTGASLCLLHGVRSIGGQPRTDLRPIEPRFFSDY
jgi:hypothetical protein